MSTIQSLLAPPLHNSPESWPVETLTDLVQCFANAQVTSPTPLWSIEDQGLRNYQLLSCSAGLRLFPSAVEHPLTKFLPVLLGP